MRSVRTRRPLGSSVRSNVPVSMGSAAPVAATGVAAGGTGRSRLGLVLLCQLERDATLPVDLGHLDEQLVADVDHVLDRAHPLALLAQLGDVQQAVLARGQRDERAEGGGLHHRPEVALADLRHDRVHLLADHVERDLELLAVGGADEHPAVVLDRDVGAGGRLDLVDALALGPDELADLGDRDLLDVDPGASMETCSRGCSIAACITSRTTMRASRAWVSALISTSLGMPVSLVSSCSAVTNSRV